MDVLSEVLKVVKLSSAFFFVGEYSAPWSVASPESCKLAPYLRAGHVILYHFVIEGRASVGLHDGARLTVGPGDIVIFPHGHGHVMENGRASTISRSDSEIQRVLSEKLKVSRLGGGGEITRFVCGYMACEKELSQVLLAGLPPIFKVNIRNDESGRWLEDSIRFSVADTGAANAGGQAVLAKLSEALFVETLRRYITELPEAQTGWLAGARDPEVGRALALMHSRPAHPWTIAQLATEVGVSRSVLASRFRHYLAGPPMAYLTRWRLQLGAQMLASTSYSVAQVAAEVGYESEPAFNRAFKRQYGVPPARYRTTAKASRVTAATARG